MFAAQALESDGACVQVLPCRLLVLCPWVSHWPFVSLASLIRVRTTYSGALPFRWSLQQGGDGGGVKALLLCASFQSGPIRQNWLHAPPRRQRLWDVGKQPSLCVCHRGYQQRYKGRSPGICAEDLVQYLPRTGLTKGVQGASPPADPEPPRACSPDWLRVSGWVPRSP